MAIKHNLQIIVSLICFAFLQSALAEDVGQIQYTRGAVTMQEVDGSSARLVAKNEVVKRGEVIKTGPKSFTIVRLNDGTRMTIRPNSSFAVEKFNPKQDSTATALLRLFRGGLRAITGYISKKNPDGYRLRTGTATIGIRGTEFDARLCRDDCEEENIKYKKSYDQQLERTVARAVFARGTLLARSTDGDSRVLKPGSAIFEGDTLITKKNAYAIIIFKDKSRVSLQANTAFRVDEMKFNEKKAEETSGLFSLLRGGLRTVTGLIGKLHPRRYSMRTSIATIGIRGTGYDLMCTGSCEVSDGDFGNQVTHLPDGDGLYAHVWEGSIEVGKQVLPTGAAMYLADASSKPVMLPVVPGFFMDNTVPKPDSFEVDEKQLFSQLKAEEAPPGLYVSVTEGVVTVKNNAGRELKLEAGQAGYTDVLGRQAKHLSKIPTFQKFDVYPLPDASNPAGVNLNAASLGGGDSDMVCEIK